MPVLIQQHASVESSVFSANGRPSTPLRIAMCPPEWLPLQQAMTGAQKADATYVIQKYVAENLQARGHELSFLALASPEHVVCSRNGKEAELAPQTWSASRWFAASSKAAWRVQRLMRIPYLNVFSNYRLYDACLQWLPGHDIVYERNGLYKYGVAAACRKLGLPYVLYFEADDILEHDIMGQPIVGLRKRRAQHAIRTNLAAADRILCVSEPLKRQLIDNWHVPAQKIAVFPNVADVERFRPDAEARADVRTALGMPANPIIIFVGNFFVWHDIPTLLAAFAQVVEKTPEARLVMVGDGAMRNTMMQRTLDLGLEKAVHFTGMIPHHDVPRFLAAADIAVVPYPALTTQMWLSPLKLYEYMAAGKAIVASSIGQLNDVLEDGRNGLLVPPGDVASMAAALSRLILDPALAGRLGEQARLDAVRKHSWSHYVTKLEQLFAEVLDEHSPAIREPMVRRSPESNGQF